MDLQHADIARGTEPISSWLVNATPSEAHHARILQGATLTGEAARQALSIRIGLWLDDSGRVRQARWRASDDGALRACAEAACSLLESGGDPLRLDAGDLSAAGSAASAGDGPELVLSAVRAAALVASPREI